MAAWFQVGATIPAVIVGAVLANIFRTQQKAKIHEKRLDAYSRLRKLTEAFQKGGQPIDSVRCHWLAQDLTKW